MSPAELPIAVIGAGPVGLAAAAHLLARGLTPLVLEAGPAVGHAVGAWGHVRMFTPWRYCVDDAARALLEAEGWAAPPAEAIPTGAELVARYLVPLGRHAAIAPHLRLNTRVLAVTRQGCDKLRTAEREALPFVLRVAGPDGAETAIAARAVIDCSGSWGQPNPAGADGLPALGEAAAAAHIRTGIPDVLGTERDRYLGRTTAVVGGGHSALNALLELAALRHAAGPETRILWIMRKANIEAAYGGEAADGLAARGALGSETRALVESGAVEVLSPFRIAEIRPGMEKVLRVLGDRGGQPGVFEADELIVATGFRPDLGMLREVRLGLDPWLECAAGIGEMIDPNLHSCGTVRPHGARELAHPERDFFIAGMKSYGRAPTFLLATGHEQVRSIAAALAGDHAAAARVELVLPETGVCSAPPSVRGVEDASASCCAPAPAAVAAASSCCAPAPAKVEAAASCCAPAPAKVEAAASSCCAPKPAPATACRGASADATA
jgi:hypothetical protein